MANRESGTAIGLLALCIGLWIATPYFATASNMANVLEQSAVVGIVAIGMTFVILTGGIDLSVGSVVALAGVVIGTLIQQQVSLPIALLAGMLVGVAAGAVNGLMISAFVWDPGRTLSATRRGVQRKRSRPGLHRRPPARQCRWR